MINEASFGEILIDEMPVQLPCATHNCNYGDEGTVYKTPPLEFAEAIQMLNIHRADAHGMQGAGGGGEAAEGGRKTQISKLPRPYVAGGCSQEDFKSSKRSWDQYIRSYNEVSDVVLRDQLLHCPEESLKRTVERALGDR